MLGRTTNLAWLWALSALTWAGAVSAQQTHWAYVPPRRPVLPVVHAQHWPHNAIDVFIAAEMDRQQLGPAPEADRRTLLRRLSLVLTGQPPTAEETAAYLADPAPDAYERMVERLLDSPRFGERMATFWLDLARYGDTHGYHMDAHRDMWRWRDWVIDAYNSNQPFDQFTIEQLAGDLLPQPTLAQRIATGFNRNNMVNFENGVIAEEFLAEYAVDRVATTATVWLGQTMICARCHDHKYDPFTQRDFYRLYAFFNQVPEHGVDGDKGNAPPFIAAPYPWQQAELERWQREMAAAEKALNQRALDSAADQLAWEARATPEETGRVESQPLVSLTFEPTEDQPPFQLQGSHTAVRGKIGQSLLFDGDTYLTTALEEPGGEFTFGVWLFPTANSHMLVAQGRGKQAWKVELDGGRIVWQQHVADHQCLEISSEATLAQRQWQHVTLSQAGAPSDGGLLIYVNGQAVVTRIANCEAADTPGGAAELFVGGDGHGPAFRGLMDEVQYFDHTLRPDEISVLVGHNPIGEILAVARDQRTTKQQTQLRDFYLTQIDTEYRRLAANLRQVRGQISQFEASLPTTMVMAEAAQRRPTFILRHGRYDAPGEQVTAGVPECLPPLSTGAPNNRLGLAHWLVSPDNPLTARVAVNHLWQLVFGAGLVRTPEDFGLRGEPPTHPELLDWLAVEFASDWDVKRLLRLLVTSATFRQSSRVGAELLERDPQNRWLARAPRLRLEAEAIRDQALAVSGLLVDASHGPSVFPYQPAGLWEEISYNPNDFTAQVYRQSHGRDLYRRSLYTFLKRSLPAPTLAAFDAGNRETCLVQRPRSNSPQQALVLMNDPIFVEAARALAQRTLQAAHASDEARLTWMFLRTTSREPSRDEQRILLALLHDLLTRYRDDPELARQWQAVGESPTDQALNAPALAAWAGVANVVLSLDEVISRN